jgi:hypothetical protein
MLDDVHRYIEEKNTHILYYRNAVKLLEWVRILMRGRAQQLEQSKTHAEYRAKTNSEKSELAGLLHQIKTKMLERGLVSADELEQSKAKALALQADVDRLRRELTKRQTESSAAIGRQQSSATVLPRGGIKKDQTTQCALDRPLGSPERTGRDMRNGKGRKGLASVLDDFETGYLEPLVRGAKAQW